MDGQMRLRLKVGRQGYLGLLWNPIFNTIYTIFDFAIIFQLKNYLPGIIIFSTTSCVLLYSYVFILTYCINTMDLKSQKTHKIWVEKVFFFLFYYENHKYV